MQRCLSAFLFLCNYSCSPLLNYALIHYMHSVCQCGSGCNWAQEPQPAEIGATHPAVSCNFFKWITGEIWEFFKNVTIITILSFLSHNYDLELCFSYFIQAHHNSWIKYDKFDSSHWRGFICNSRRAQCTKSFCIPAAFVSGMAFISKEAHMRFPISLVPYNSCLLRSTWNHVDFVF